MSDLVQEKLSDAALHGRVSEVSSLLNDHPEINVNWIDEIQYTALHIASLEGHDEVVKLLLAHPDINVNVKDDVAQTPLSKGCEEGKVSVVRMLLKDPRVDVTLDDRLNRTPLWWASDGGRDDVIEWLIASGRDLGDFQNKKGGGRMCTALQAAPTREVVSLLERFIANPTLTRHEVRVNLGVLEEVAAEVFALTVFLCDDLLQLKPALGAASTSEFARRFFTITKRLPMELQMILCHSAVGSPKQNILRRDSEAAFKSLARILLLDLSQPHYDPFA